MTTNTPELRACPFCGGSAEAEAFYLDDKVFAIECRRCGGAFHARTNKGSIDGWNHRAGETTWQPISSAPRDGARILTYHTGGFCKVMFWGHSDEHGDCWFVDASHGQYAFKAVPFITKHKIATHWMPLPESPKT